MKKKPRFEIRRAHTASACFYFVAIAPNGRVIVTSELYSSKPMCRRGVLAIANAVRNGSIVDTTER